VQEDRVQSDLEVVRVQYDDSGGGDPSPPEDRIEKLERGDELPPGVLKMVKVFVAVKRKPQPATDGRPSRQQGRDQPHPSDHAAPGGRTHADIVLAGRAERMNVGRSSKPHLANARGLGKQIGTMLEGHAITR